MGLLTVRAEVSIQMPDGLWDCDMFDMLIPGINERILRQIGNRNYEIVSIESNVLETYDGTIVDLYKDAGELYQAIGVDLEKLFVSVAYVTHYADDIRELIGILENGEYICIPDASNAYELGDSLYAQGYVLDPLISELRTITKDNARAQVILDHLIQDLDHYVDFDRIGDDWLQEYVGGFTRIYEPAGVHGYVFFPDTV